MSDGSGNGGNKAFSLGKLGQGRVARKWLGKGGVISITGSACGVLLAAGCGMWGGSSYATPVTSDPITASSQPQAAQHSSAPAPKVTETAYGDWVLRCASVAGSTQKSCELNQFLQNGNKQIVSEIAIGHAPGEAAGLHLVVVLPDNVALQTPVRASDQHDNGFNLTFERCLPAGCFASAAFTGSVVATWRGDNDLGRLAFKDGTNNPIVWPFSLRGLPKALDALHHQGASNQ